MRNVLDKSFSENQNILCSLTFFENRIVYEIMSKIIVEPVGPDMTSQRGAYELHAE